MSLKISDVYKRVEESERMDLFYDSNEEVDASDVGSFITELSEKVNPLNILKVDIDTLFLWKEMEEVELRTSAILTIINNMLPQFRLNRYVPYA